MDGLEGRRVADYLRDPASRLATGPDGAPIFVDVTGPPLWSLMEEISFQNAVAAETRFVYEQRAVAAAAANIAIRRHEVALAGGLNG